MRWLDGRRIKRNELCPCGSGLKLKRCCIRLAEDRPADTRGRAGAFITAEDMWPTGTLDWKRTLDDIRQFDGRWFCELMSRIGVLLHDEYLSMAPKRESAVRETLFDEQDRAKLELWLQSGKRQKTFARQTILAALICRLHMDNKGPSSSSQNLQAVGPLLLRLGSLLEMRPVQSSEGAVRRETWEESLGSVFRVLYLSADPDYASGIARYWLLYLKGFHTLKEVQPSQHFNLPERFHLATRLSIEQALAFGLSIWIFYSKDADQLFARPENFRFGPDYFRETAPNARGCVEEALSLLSASWEEHVKAADGAWTAGQYFDFRQLYNTPLIEVYDAVYFLTDIPLLEARITDGIFWAAFDAISGREKEQLKTAFGRVFEWYAEQVLTPLRKNRSFDGLWTEADGSPTVAASISIPDVVAIEADQVFVVEATTLSLPPSVYLRGELDAIRAGLLAIWVGAGDQKGKLEQLQDACDAIAAGAMAFPHMPRPLEPTLWPILLTHRPLPQLEALSELYRQWLVEAGLSESFVSRLTFLSITEFEQLVAWKVDGTNWTQLFISKHGREFMNDPMQSVIVHQLREYKKHPILVRAHEEVFDAMQREMFGQGNGSTE